MFPDLEILLHFKEDKMNTFETISESFVVLKTNKLRTGLSALGIIIGIASVITLITLGTASQKSVRERIQSLGSNLLIVRPGNSQQGFVRSSEGNTSLKYSDEKAIENSDRLFGVSMVAGEYSGRAQVAYGKNNTSVSVSGVTEKYFNLRNIILEEGNEFSKEEILGNEKSAILGTGAATDLYTDGSNPLGTDIRINGVSFKVIGVTKSKGGAGVNNPDNVVYVPLDTAQKILFGVSHLNAIYVSAKDETVMEGLKNQLGFLLLELHKKKTPADADFSIQSQAEILETVNEITKTFTSLLTGIATISLVVGGIGVMNIMLVTVAERTREIGLRKALGAKKSDILKQFLIEAIILTTSGGVMGIILGLLISAGIIKYMNLPYVFSLNAVIVSALVSGVIGIIFGVYPARRAANLQPIEALRYE